MDPIVLHNFMALQTLEPKEPAVAYTFAANVHSKLLLAIVHLVTDHHDIVSHCDFFMLLIFVL